MDSPKILIVEDNSIVAEDIRIKLGHMGYENVTTATTYEKAMKAAESDRPHMALMDIKLGGEKNGIDTAEALMREYEVPVVYLTAFADEETIARAKITEPYGYVVKPFDDKELRSAVEIALYKRRADQKVRESRKWLQTTLSSIGDGVIATDPHGHVTFLNPAAEHLTGWRQREAVGKPVKEIFHLINEETLQVVENPVDLVLRIGTVVGLANHTLLITKEGRKIPIADSGAPIKDDKGQIMGVVLVFRDQTEERKAQNALEESERRLRTLVGNLPGIAFRCLNDENWTMSYISHGCKVLTGYEAIDLIDNRNLSYGNLIVSGDRRKVWNEIQSAVKEDRSYTIEYKIIDRNRAEKWVWERGRCVARPDGGVAILEGFISDISDRKKAEAEREQLKKQLIRSHKMEAIGTLAGGIAHDFNNILGIILGHAELAMDDVPEWNPARQNLDEVKKASLRAKDLVSQILSFSRKSEIEWKPLELGAVVTESLRFLRASIPASIDIRRNIANPKTHILGDTAQIYQIMMNLCTNAAHSMEKDGGILEISVENKGIDAETASRYSEIDPGPHVQLCVSDTGEGMDFEVMERIFDPYFTTKDVGKGTGLGLSVVHGIVKSHNGRISVMSEPGKGATFNILFPAVEKEILRDTDASQEPPTGAEHILFVDDETSMVNLNRQRLERLGYTVTGAEDPLEALNFFRSNPNQIDLIITDMTMPRMNGDKLAREILKIRPDTPIILCTGYSDKISEETSRRFGIRQYIEKPIEMKDLARTIREVLDGLG